MITQLAPMPGSTAMDSSPGDRPLDLIFIEGFTGQTVIGIHDTELHRPQPLRIDVQAGVPRSRACDTDRIGDTIDYSVVRTRLLQLMHEHKLQLLEAFAEEIARILVVEFGAQWVRVRVVKPRKFEDVDSVGVMIERRSADWASTAPQAAPSASRGAAVLQLIGAGMVPGSQ